MIRLLQLARHVAFYYMMSIYNIIRGKKDNDDN